MKDKKARWIWLPGGGRKKNEFACFRKTLPLPAAPKPEETPVLQITADSRYFLYLNGAFAGTGPGRYWPETPWTDRYSLEGYGNSGTLTIAVLVWHYGTSTSQYIHDEAGLLAEISGPRGEIPGSTDSGWRCLRHGGYRQEVPRINISQPWLEMYDAAAAPAGWTETGFDDSRWLPAEEVHDKFRSRQPAPSPLPLPASQIKIPEACLRSRTVRPEGQGFRIDYRESFYPGDTSTEDRLHSGFLAACIDSPAEQDAVLTLLDRRWPLTAESFHVNGRGYTIPPDADSAGFPLRQGENLFLFDISGAFQRVWADLHFSAPRPPVFRSPFPGDRAPFAAAGPFESFRIGNIVCSDGFSLDPAHPEYRAVRSCASCGELTELKDLFAPSPAVYRNLPKHRGTRKQVLSSLPREALPGAGVTFTAGGKGARLQIPAGDGGDREILIDMGEEVSGFLEFTLECAGNTVLEILFFEYLSPAGEPEIPIDLDTSLRFTSVDSGVIPFRSVLRRGFRYMQLTIQTPGEAVLDDLRVDQRLYPVTREGLFRCSDPLLNDIDEVCRRTLRLCREDTYVDCPAFEQALWLGDVPVTARGNHMIHQDPELTEHSLQLGADSLNHTFLPDCHLPAGLHLQLTAWSLLWVLTCADHYRRTRREAFRRKITPAVCLTLTRFQTLINREGLLETAAWNMLDWADMDTPYRGVIAHQNALLVRALEDGAFLAEGADTGVTEEEIRGFRARARQLREAVNRAFWSEEHQAYRDCIREDGTPSPVFSVQTGLMMRLCGCVPSEREEAVKQFILNPPENAVVCGSPFLTGFLLDFLFRENREDRALEEIRRIWGPMIESGSTTCWETSPGFYKDRLTRSYCHGWSVSPAALFRTCLLGIPEDAGTRRQIRIAPRPGGLNWASGSVPLPEGELEVSWSVRDGEFNCRIISPPGVRVSLQLPEGLREGDIRNDTP